MLVVLGFAGILFQMEPRNADGLCAAIRQLNINRAFTNDGVRVLADLIALRQIGVEVILAIKTGPEIDLGIQAKPGTHGLRHAFMVDHRQHAGEARINEGNLGIGFRTKGRRCTGKQLGVGRDLGMNLKPDHHFPGA